MELFVYIYEQEETEMKKKMLLIWVLVVCLCACAAAEAAQNPTAALLETVRGDYGWMQPDGSLYHGARLHCSLHDADLEDAAICSSEESYLETMLSDTDTIVVIGTFATSHSVEAFMDCEFMPAGDIGRPEDYAEIAGGSYNQYRFITAFADAKFAVDAFSFSAGETIFLFLTARDVAAADSQAEYQAQLDDWIATMQILPAEG